ncbi:MAG: hypothetical protein Q7V88_13045 [Actinomycetota bacterium]|nr:hypothetical protein [Actinomycetota bacterium]
MSLFDKQQQFFEALHQQMQALCPPDDPLVGAFIGTQSKAFSNQLFGVGVTRNLLVLQPLDRKQQPDGAPVWLRPGDITNAAIWGQGGGFREWIAADSEYQLRFSTANGDKYKIMAMGGWTMAKAMGDKYIQGLEAVADWLARCQR